MIHLALPAILHLIQVAAPSAVTPFQWASNYIHVVAWPTICVVLWQASKKITKFADKIETTTDQIDSMATNHFPHMEQYLLEIKTILAERK